MAAVTLTVAGAGSAQSVELDPAGTVIGRSRQCDVVLDDRRVSRRHARIFRDPFGQWVVEDLGSQIGVRVNDERVETAAIPPGGRVQIGPFTLFIAEPAEAPGEGDPDADEWSAATDVGEGAEAVCAAPAGAAARTELGDLNAIVDRLAEVTDLDQVYPEACRLLAELRGVTAAVVRLPRAPEPLPSAPQVLAFAVGEATAEGAPRLRLSRRVLERVQTTGQSLTAGMAKPSGGDANLNAADDADPRTICCVPLTGPGRAIDALYVDLPGGPGGAGPATFVQAAARQVILACKALLLAEATARRRSLDHQLTMAREVQARLVPGARLQVPGAEVAVCYEPAMGVGGNYLDGMALPDGRLAFAVGDVSGKGLPAAMLMANLQAAFRATLSFCTDLPAAVEHIDGLVRRNLPSGMSIMLVAGLFDPRTGKLEYVNAGHSPPVLIRRAGRASPLDPPKNLPLGVHEGPFRAEAETLAPGASLIVATDGITECLSPQGELFGRRRFVDAARQSAHDSAEAVVQAVTEAAAAFRAGQPPQEDIAVMVILYRGAEQAGPG